jgi:hypothetical protein
MAEMDFDYPAAAPTLQELFESAKGFGLSDDEVWRVVNESQFWAGPDATIPEYLDELAGALAHRIVIKERKRSRSRDS